VVLWDIENQPLAEPCIMLPAFLVRLRHALRSWGCLETSVVAAVNPRALQRLQAKGLDLLLEACQVTLLRVADFADAADAALISHAYLEVQAAISRGRDPELARLPGHNNPPSTPAAREPVVPSVLDLCVVCITQDHRGCTYSAVLLSRSLGDCNCAAAMVSLLRWSAHHHLLQGLLGR
jgi:hypothetical protein